MRIGRFGVGVCQIADCDLPSVLRIFTIRYKHASAPTGFEFHFDLCTDHRFEWERRQTELGGINRVESR